MKSSIKRWARPRVNNLFPHGTVELKTGEAVVGRVADIFDVQGSPDQINRAYLYFSVPGATFSALGKAFERGELKVSVERGGGVLRENVIVRVRAPGHCVYIAIPSNDADFSVALKGFADAGRFPVAIASQAVKRQPLVFESNWQVREVSGIESIFGLENLVLRGESQALGKPSQFVTCTAETPYAWKRRLSAQAV